MANIARRSPPERAVAASHPTGRCRSAEGGEGAGGGGEHLHFAEERPGLHAERVGGDRPYQGDEDELQGGEGHQRGRDIEEPCRHQRGHAERSAVLKQGTSGQLEKREQAISCDGSSQEKEER